MNSEKQKREQEIERLMAEAGKNREADIAFQEEIKKTAAAIIEKETLKIQKTERAERRRGPVSPMTLGIWLLLLGTVGFLFSMPSLGGMLLLCGVAAIVWSTFPRLPQASRPKQPSRRSYSRIWKTSAYRWRKRFRR
jgi:hypothetical protein